MTFRQREQETAKTAVANLAMFLGMSRSLWVTEVLECYIDSVVRLGVDAGLEREDFNCFDLHQPLVDLAFKTYSQA